MKHIRGLNFYITDVDAVTSSPYGDRVVIVPDATNARQSRDANISGLGTEAHPWKADEPNTNAPENSGARVRVNYPHERQHASR